MDDVRSYGLAGFALAYGTLAQLKAKNLFSQDEVVSLFDDAILMLEEMSAELAQLSDQQQRPIFDEARRGLTELLQHVQGSASGPKHGI